METSLTDLESRGTQGHRWRKAIGGRRVKRIGLQRDIGLEAIRGKRIMMRNIGAKRSKNSLLQTRTTRLGASIRQRDGQRGGERRKRERAKLVAEREVIRIIGTRNQALENGPMIRGGIDDSEES
jgi:hypothetical protein